jgi:hypothetical protein
MERIDGVEFREDFVLDYRNTFHGERTCRTLLRGIYDENAGAVI